MSKVKSMLIGTTDYKIDADTVNGHTVEANVPSGAKFTDTVYDPPRISWGRTLTATPRNHQAVLLIDHEVMANVWLPSTNKIGVLCVSEKGIKKKGVEGANTLSFSASESAIPFTITRNGDSFTVTTSENVGMRIYT